MFYLIDTNIFLDIFLKREPYNNDAKLFLQHCLNNEDKTFVTTMTLRDIEYIASRVLHDKSKGKEIQRLTYSACSKVIGNSEDDAINALYSNMKDYEDALMVEAARSNSINAIITNNLKNYKGCGFPVFSPRQILEMNIKFIKVK